MIKFTVFYIIGIVAFKFFPFFPVSLSILLIAITFFLFSKFHKDRRGTLLTIFACLFGVLCSFVQHETLPEIEFSNEEVFIQGTIIDVPESSEEKVSFTIGQVDIEGEDLKGKVRLVIYQEKFYLNIRDVLFPGDRINALAKLRAPRFFRNPGVFSYDLKKDGIVATGYIKQLKIVGRNDVLLSRINRSRQMLGKIMDNSLSAENASFLKAIIPGLKRGISQEMRDSFGATGLAHLLSISGTHFGLLAFIVFSLVRTCIKSIPIRILTRMTLYITPTRIAVLLTMPVLILYALISGGSTPTVRSLIMVSIYMAALFLGRKGQWLNSLSIAAFIILVPDPAALFEISFLLSFLAVLSIGYVMENREHTEDEDAKYKPVQIPFGPDVSLLTRVITKVKTAILITVAAVLGTAPVVVLFFKQIPLISPVTNLIVTPIVCFAVLPLGFLSGFLALMFNMSSMPFSGLLDLVTWFSLQLIEGFSFVPFSNYHLHNPSFVLIVLYYLSIIFFVRGIKWWRILPFVLVVCFYLAGPHLKDDKFEITFLDVGQGDASVVELPDKKIMLIDGGTFAPDAGRRVVAPYLWSKGIGKVDYLVSSHLHSDHSGGLIHIIDNFSVKEVWLNGRTTDEADLMFQKIRERKIRSRILQRGDILKADKYSIHIFHPYKEFFSSSGRGGYSDQNSDSLVLKIESDAGSILFTGDIEKEAEENLGHLGRRLKSDIIKVPHHGSRTSSSLEFIEAVDPETAVISAGRDNTFKHPHKETLVKYRNAGVKLFGTDVSGAVTIKFKNGSYEVETYKDSRLIKVLNWRDEIRNLKLLY